MLKLDFARFLSFVSSGLTTTDLISALLDFWYTSTIVMQFKPWGVLESFKHNKSFCSSHHHSLICQLTRPYRKTDKSSNHFQYTFTLYSFNQNHSQYLSLKNNRRVVLSSCSYYFMPHAHPMLQHILISSILSLPSRTLIVHI